jgi:hypothetical protein
MEEKELIKNYLESINFSTYGAYIDLILKYVEFKEKYLKSLIKEPVVEEPQKATKGAKK